jgi:hypothetical protein
VNYLRTLTLDGTVSPKKGPSRRQLLRALGVSAAAAPMVPMLDGWARAADAAPKRLLLVFTPDGIVPDQWWPKGTETEFTFPAILEPLNRHKADMIVLKDMPRHNGGSGGAHEHGMGGLWTGNSISSNQPMAASIDQIIAKGMPTETDFQSLQFGVQSFFNQGDANAKAASVNSYMIYSGPRAKIPAESDPYKMFDRIFGSGFKPPTGGAPQPGGPDMTVDRVRAEKKSILDFLKADLDDVRAKLGKDDGAKVDAHLESIRDIERRLMGGGSSGPVLTTCTPGGRPQMLDLNNNASFPALIPLTQKMVAAAFACDRTRIASLQYSRGFSNHVHNWVGANATHHTLSHGTQNAPVLGRIQTWYMTHIAQLLDDLKAVQEGGVSMLDNMLVVYGNELYLGWTHGVSPEPCWWAGKLGGRVKPGRFLDFAGKFDWNQMLQTLTALYGVNVPKVGDLGNSGTIPPLMS